jgi:hypothetical protein
MPDSLNEIWIVERTVDHGMTWHPIPQVLTSLSNRSTAERVAARDNECNKTNPIPSVRHYVERAMRYVPAPENGGAA